MDFSKGQLQQFRRILANDLLNHLISHIGFLGILALIGSLFLSSCINGGGFGSQKLSGSGYLNGSAGGPGGLLASYNCPDEENIIPVFDEQLADYGYYTACTHVQNLEAILMSGDPYHTSEICVYPVEVMGPNDIRVKPHPTDGGIWRECKVPTNGYYTFNFGGSSLNAVIVVENYGFNQDLMDLCLVSENYYQCPDFSIGRTR